MRQALVPDHMAVPDGDHAGGGQVRGGYRRPGKQQVVACEHGVADRRQFQGLDGDLHRHPRFGAPDPDRTRGGVAPLDRIGLMAQPLLPQVRRHHREIGTPAHVGGHLERLARVDPQRRRVAGAGLVVEGRGALALDHSRSPFSISWRTPRDVGDGGVDHLGGPRLPRPGRAAGRPLRARGGSRRAATGPTRRRRSGKPAPRGGRTPPSLFAPV